MVKLYMAELHIFLEVVLRAKCEQSEQNPPDEGNRFSFNREKIVVNDENSDPGGVLFFEYKHEQII